jgi:hypothetical protein
VAGYYPTKEVILVDEKPLEEMTPQEKADSFDRQYQENQAAGAATAEKK